MRSTSTSVTTKSTFLAGSRAIGLLLLWPCFGAFVFFVLGGVLAHGPGAAVFFAILGLTLAIVAPFINYLLYAILKARTGHASLASVALTLSGVAVAVFVLLSGGWFDFH